MNISVGVKTDVGRSREVNEDSFLVQEPLFVVADGMGGHVAGDVASTTAVERLAEATRDETPAAGSLSALVRGANAAVFNRARSDPSLQGMGTTCTVLLLEGTDAHLAHVGDSRAYLLRDHQLQQLTEDHTLVQRMVKEGRLNQEEASRHPQRNIITRVLGVDADIAVDTYSVEARPGDRFLLCSDGLSSMLDDAEIEAALRRGDDAQSTADRLVEQANEAGGEDNITVVIVDIEGANGGASEAPPVERARASEDVEPAATPAKADSMAMPAVAAQGGGEDSSPGRKTGPRWRRILIAIVLVVAIAAAAAYIGVRYLWIERSFYVGVDEAGVVTIYRGIPEDIAGLTLHREEEATELEIADLPEFLQEDLRAGIEAGSLEDAHARVADLEEIATDEEFQTENRQDQDAEQGGGKG